VFRTYVRILSNNYKRGGFKNEEKGRKDVKTGTRRVAGKNCCG
jgi:hypothetical protein